MSCRLGASCAPVEETAEEKAPESPAEKAPEAKEVTPEAPEDKAPPEEPSGEEAVAVEKVDKKAPNE